MGDENKSISKSRNVNPVCGTPKLGCNFFNRNRSLKRYKLDLHYRTNYILIKT